jgi:hypothetical protein
MSFDAPTVGQTQLVITVHWLSPLAIFFLAGTEFGLRDPLLIKRAFDVHLQQFGSRRNDRSSGKIPSQLYGRAVVLAGWIEGEHPAGPCYGTGYTVCGDHPHPKKEPA